MFNKTIRIIVEHDELNFTAYDYWFYDGNLVLDDMHVLRRKTKRHGMKLIYAESYSRLMQRDFGIKEEPDVDIEIQLEALKQFRASIGVVKWK